MPKIEAYGILQGVEVTSMGMELKIHGLDMKSDKMPLADDVTICLWTHDGFEEWAKMINTVVRVTVEGEV